MAELSGEGVRVLLIGTASHQGADPVVADSVVRAFRELRTVLVERCGVAAERVRAVLDPADARSAARIVVEEARAAESVLLVYFVGRCVVDGDGELYLAAADTGAVADGMAEHEALSVGSVVRAVRAGRARSVAVVLDCVTDGADVARFAVPDGVYLLGSVSAGGPVLSGVFLDLLVHGDPRGPRRLTLDSVHDALFRQALEQDAPVPRRHAGADALVLADNPVEGRAVPTPAGEVAPYRGLRPFRVEDAAVFAGRERVVESLVGAAGFAVLVGPPGSGKTSLLHAGVEARLREVATCRSITPGPSPLGSLVSALDAEPGAVEVLREEPDRVVDLVDGPLVLLVDRLEELFTRCSDPAERAAFVRALTALAERSRVVAALDAGFDGHVDRLPEWARVPRDHRVPVEPMTTAERRAAIEEPAAAAGLELEDGLADLVLAEVEELAPLSHVLWATWTRREGTVLTVAGYRAAGGPVASIGTHAEQVYRDLDAVEREAARRVLPRLVRTGDGDPVEAVEAATLVAGLPDVPAGRRVVDAFTEAGLLTSERDVVRIGHAVLPHAWPRLGEWLEADRDWWHACRRITADAVDWERAGHDKSLLYRGNRLAAANLRAAAAPGRAADLNPRTARFLDASWRGERRRTGRRRALVALLALLALLAPAGLTGAVVFGKQAARARDHDLARFLAAESEDVRDRQPGLAKQLGVLAYRLAPDAGERAMLAAQRLPGVIADRQVVTDLLPAGDGRVLVIATTDGVTLRGRDGAGRIDRLLTGAVAVTKDGTGLVAADFDSARAWSGVLRFWDISDPANPRQTAETPMPSVVASLAFTDDGRTLYGGTAAGGIQVWDVADRAEPRALTPVEGYTSRVDSLAVAPGRGLLAGASADGKVRIWDLADAAHPTPVADLVGAAHEPSSGEARQPLHRVAFDRTGRLLATAAVAPEPGGTDLGNPLVWRLTDPRSPERLPYRREDGYSVGPCSGDDVTSLAFSPHDDHLVAVCDGHWHVLTYAGDPGVLTEATSTDLIDREPGPVVFDPTGPRLLQATAIGVHVWNLSNPYRPGAKGFLGPEPGTGGRLDYRAAGGRDLIAVQNVGVNTLWDVEDVTRPRKLTTTDAPGTLTGGSLALTADGGLLAAPEVSPDGKTVGVALRRTAPAGARPLAVIEDLDNGIGDIAFSPTEPLLAVSDVNGLAARNLVAPSLRLYDISDPTEPRQIARLPLEVWGMAFSPDGVALTLQVHGDVATVSFDPEAGKQLRSLDVTDPEHPAELWRKVLPPGLSTEFAYSPDGSRLIAFDTTQTLRVWPVRDHLPIGDPVRAVVGTGSGGGRLAFSPDGRRLALIARSRSGSNSDTRPEVWDVSGAPVRQFYLPGSEYVSFYDLAFSPDGRTLAVVRGGAGVDLWDTDPAAIVAGLCAAVGDPITREQWEHYLPGRDYRPPCG
ncbi:hypothetical protein [Actinosynnema sp. NPDC020468]|uniref:nSTAND1 domain-containing NTPase n=1 Tax=Actinosynnema sp. NPDC020468 TaxID=3154488 RepID=UPI0033D73A7B